MINKAALVAALLFLPSSHALAAQVSLGPSFSHHQFKEYSSSGSQLLVERGETQGYRFAIKEKAGDFLFSITLDQTSGSLNYSSINAESQTQIDSHTFRISSGYKFDQRHSLIALQALLQKRRYDRHIESTSFLFGLKEQFDFTEAGLELSLEYPINDRIDFSIHGHVLYAIEQDVQVEFLSGAFDTTNFPIGSTQSGGLILSAYYQIDNNWRAILNVDHSYQESARSDSFSLTFDGEQTTSQVTQPQIKSQVTALTLSFERTF